MIAKKLSFKQQKLIVVFLGIALLLMGIICLCIGRYSVNPLEAIEIIFKSIIGDIEDVNPVKLSVVTKIRLPRVLMSIIIGMGIAGAGTSYQAIFSNPLVSPDILGVSSGAGFGAALGILISTSSNIFTIQGMALTFGILSVVIVLAISRIQKKTELFVLVLSGVIVSSLFEALVSLIKYVSDPQDKLPAITVWLMGSLANSSYNDLLAAACVILPCLAVLLILRWKMNLLSLDEEEAISLGINVKKLRIVIIVISTLITAVSVSLCGIIGWIGLVIPHVARLFIGTDHRVLVPSSIFLGGIYLMIIDTIARAATSAEIPISILTAIIGAPFFAWLLRKTSKS